jgi:hypothetical protein
VRSWRSWCWYRHRCRHTFTKTSQLVLVFCEMTKCATGTFRYFFFPWRNSPYLARESSLSKLHDHRHVTLGRTPLDECPSAETSTSQHATLTRDRHPWPWRDPATNSILL